MVKGFISVLVIWIIIFSAAYLYFDTRLEPRVSAAREYLENGSVIIPRSWDGHYYVQGSVNGFPVKFMIDTGASVVSVGKQFARSANLPAGRPASFATAGGVVQGEMVFNQTIEAGGIVMSGLQVSVGLHGDVALLGQNFLRNIDVIQSNDTMILKFRTR
ncbi:aspartyl protease family protein [Nitrosomonas marina]|uniref:Aspartyl protease family protein n=1 Tax=Nitrosomonas marina TaxID=917 RepID=A0A1I0DQL4_9PROT|nr:retropepsin-like aspartic protease [Nitrosomonas marina]SET34215.1 aspartyl protease family protein [Nitrosomonas marina]